jgi:hypothetical protein
LTYLAEAKRYYGQNTASTFNNRPLSLLLAC